MKLTTGGRRLVAAALVQSLGIGLFMASSMAFYTRQVGLTPNQVATGLATAGGVALLVSLYGGVLADRYGARRVLAVVYVGRAVCCGAYAFVTSFWQFVVVTLCAVACDRAGPPVLQALVANAVPEQQERTRLLAVVNVVRNCGLGVGAMAAGGALVSDTSTAYRIVLATIACAFLCGALLVLRVREEHGRKAGTRASREAGAPGRRTLPDARYLALTGLNFLLSFFDALLLVAMPVWVLDHTDAPRVTVSVLFAVNTVLVVVLQIPVSRFADGLHRTSRMLTWTGAVLAVGSLCFAAAGGSPGWASVAWLAAAVAALSLGEVIANAAVWDLSIALAPPEARGRYLSVFNLSINGQRVLGPIIVTGLLLGGGTAGWIGAALVFAVAGMAAERVALTAGRSIGAPATAPAEA
ncbi:MFS transporter [Streptomyces triticiradicis]|nr:MFS transporter [Streptomyces triticiradicis]